MDKEKGKLIIVSAPSGAGKTTLVKHLLSQMADLQFSISATSRTKRQNEEDGEDYYFLSVEEFHKLIDEDAFLEWEEVYHGVFYGTLKREVRRITSAGHHVIFDVDVIGGLNIKKQFPEQAISIFVQPPSLEVLEQRLRKRSTDSEESIHKRLSKGKFELGFANEFDTILINDQLDEACKSIVEIVENFILNGHA